VLYLRVVLTVFRIETDDHRSQIRLLPLARRLESQMIFSRALLEYFQTVDVSLRLGPAFPAPQTGVMFVSHGRYGRGQDFARAVGWYA